MEAWLLSAACTSTLTCLYGWRVLVPYPWKVWIVSKAKLNGEGPIQTLTREAILSHAGQRQYDYVAVPEWGGKVKIQELTGSERDDYEAQMFRMRGRNVEQNLHNVRAKLVYLSCVNEDGSRMFSVEDVETLGRLSAAALGRVFDASRILSGLREEDIEEMAGKSGTTETSNFSTG